MPTDFFFTQEEAAKMLRVSLPSVMRRRKDGRIPYQKIGNRVLIPREFIERLVREAMSSTEPMATEGSR
jgi:excisionase family DNA binding protein